MGTFRHTPDNGIFINTSYMPLSFFITLVPTYALPATAISADYTQGVGVVWSSATSIVSSSVTYTDGDTYIANETSYMAAYNSYLNPSPSLADAKIQKINEMIYYSNSIKNGHVLVTISAVQREYFSDVNTLNQLMQYDNHFTRVGMPVGFYVNDVTYTQRVMGALSDLELIIDRIIDLYYLTDLNVDVHRTAINALGSVATVQAYDYTAGWQTIPY